ncbi:lachesin [Eurytemora carolleeae]|uniref:lachesin n=1 Tax=Eurytemora carolleeae TaxID=1294199 RepID=UPI000C77810E|nr:lachesin [Eurytemora carolleeae]|eukprot:XP_023343455.1 lachesin-like [Eurytemora affinis]
MNITGFPRSLVYACSLLTCTCAPQLNSMLSARALNPILSSPSLIKAKPEDDISVECRVKFSEEQLQHVPTLQWVYSSLRYRDMDTEHLLREIQLQPQGAGVGGSVQGVPGGHEIQADWKEVLFEKSEGEGRVGVWTLHLKNIQENNEGRYSCKVMVENSQQTFSRETLVTVKNKKVSQSRDSDKYVLYKKAGGNVTLDCLDMEGRDGANISGIPVWRKNGEVIVENGTQLKLIRVDKEDSGVYHCVVSGYNKNITVQVQHAPSVLPLRETVKQYPGFSVSMSCKVTSLPVPLIRWYKIQSSADESTPAVQYIPVIIQSNNNISIHLDDYKDGMIISRLQFLSVSAQDYGTYSCNASNLLGKVTFFTTIMIKMIFNNYNKQSEG